MQENHNQICYEHSPLLTKELHGLVNVYRHLQGKKHFCKQSGHLIASTSSRNKILYVRMGHQRWHIEVSLLKQEHLSRTLWVKYHLNNRITFHDQITTHNGLIVNLKLYASFYHQISSSLPFDIFYDHQPPRNRPKIFLNVLYKWLQKDWWRSSGQCARLFRRSEFESHWSLQFFFCKMMFEKDENKTKKGRGWPI